MTRHARLLESPVARRALPIFADAERVIADPIVRNRGTIGGSFCQADPSEDLVGGRRRAAGHDRDPLGIGRHRDGRRPASSTTARTRRWSGRPRSSPRCASRSARRRQRLREGRAAGRRLGRRRRRRVRRARRRRPSPTCGIGLTAVGAPHFCAPDGRGRTCRGRPATDENLAAAGRAAAASRATRRPTSAGRPTTSATSPASSRCGRCAARWPEREAKEPDHAGDA